MWDTFLKNCVWDSETISIFKVQKISNEFYFFYVKSILYVYNQKSSKIYIALFSSLSEKDIHTHTNIL